MMTHCLVCESELEYAKGISYCPDMTWDWHKRMETLCNENTRMRIELIKEVGKWKLGCESALKERDTALKVLKQIAESCPRECHNCPADDEYKQECLTKLARHTLWKG